MNADQGRPAAERITVGIDGSPASRRALGWAIDHARDSDTVTLVNVWEPSPAMVDAGLSDPDDNTAAPSLAHRELTRAQTLLRHSGATLRSETLRGDPRHCLCQLDTDLLVVGARGQGGMAGRLLGSVSYYLARHAPAPLVIVPSPHR